MAEYLEAEKIEVYTTEWVDITQYVVRDIISQWGIQGNTPSDRVASTGDFKITLNNASGLFSPGNIGALSGFTKDIPIRYTVTYDNVPIVKFYGRISSIRVDSGTYGEQHTEITALDWLEIAARHKLAGFGVETNKTVDEAIQTIVSDIPIQPLFATYEAGENIFPTVFDDIQEGTKALSEMTKLALSEMGWVYLRRNTALGEELVVDSKTSRDSKDIASLPVKRSSAGFLKLTTGDYLLKTDDGKIVLNTHQQFTFDNLMTSMSSEFGEGILNDIEFVSYPRRVDTSVQVLYSTSERIPLAAGETKDNLKVQYKDPSGGAIKVNADPATMITPVSGTDYTMYQNSDGTGTNLTASLTVSVSYASDGAIFSIQNTGGTDGYVYLQFRGYGIYIQDPIIYRAYDQTSIDEHGYKSLSISQRYQSEPYISAGLANTLLNVFLEPKTDVNTINFIANTNEQTMLAFLYLDIGDKLYVRETKTGVDDEYFIQNIKLRITTGGIIYVEYAIVPAVSVNPDAWLVEIDGRTELNETTIVGY